MMKQLFLFFSFIGVVSLVAQNLDLRDDQDNSIAGRTFYIFDNSVINLSDTKFHVYNSSGSPIDFDITVWELSNVTDVDLQVCFGLSCFVANHSVTTAQSFSSATAPAAGTYPDAKVAPFAFSWSNNNSGVWRVRINDQANISDSAWAYVFWGLGNPAGDQDLNGMINGNEIAGDIDNSGTINNGEITGDMNSNGIIDAWEVSGDTNGNGIIDNGEVLSVDDRGDRDFVFSIYPNPASDNLNVNYSIEEEFEGAQIKVYDMLGQHIRQINLLKSRGNLNIDVQELVQGLYFLKVVVGGKVIRTERVAIK